AQGKSHRVSRGLRPVGWPRYEHHIFVEVFDGYFHIHGFEFEGMLRAVSLEPPVAARIQAVNFNLHLMLRNHDVLAQAGNLSIRKQFLTVISDRRGRRSPSIIRLGRVLVYSPSSFGSQVTM